MRYIRFSDWIARRGAGRKRVEQIETGFATPYRRERPRDAAEAQFLRERGTPEELVGPERRS